MMRLCGPRYRTLCTTTVWACLFGQVGPIIDDTIKPVHFEELSYPIAARLTNVQGAVVVRVKLDAMGKAVSAEAISGARKLVPESLDNAKKWRFQPTSEKTVVIVYNFRIEGLCNLPCPS